MQKCLRCEQDMVLPTTWFHVVTCPPLPVYCSDCERQLERIVGETCLVCHRPFSRAEQHYRKGDMCYDCVRWEGDAEWKDALRMNHSVYTYNDTMKDVLATAKFRGDIALFAMFESPFQQAYTTHFPHIDLVVPIPLSNERLYERGFNQATVLAAFLPARIEELLTRTHTEKQSKKSRAERIHVENVFRYNKSNRLTGQSILLIDDIYTTGSTLRHAANILREQGAGEIFSLTLVRG